MRHDRVRAGIEPGVALTIPWLDVWQTKVNAVRLDKERGYGRSVSHLFEAVTSLPSCRALTADRPVVGGGNVARTAVEIAAGDADREQDQRRDLLRRTLAWIGRTWGCIDQTIMC